MDKHPVSMFLGDCLEYLGSIAKHYDPSAWLLDHSSLFDFENHPHNSPVTVYTSLGDLPKNLCKVYEILKKANVIFYCPPDRWSDGKKIDILDPGSSMQGLTEVLLMLLPKSIDVQGFIALSLSNYDPNPLVDQRKSQHKQMWIAGCSVSHGNGIDPDQRYGELLSREMKLQCSFLTRNGSSIEWSADQILRSDIRSGDIVIWGITGWRRITYIHDHRLLPGVNVTSYEVNPEYQNIVSIEQLFSSQTFANHFYAIQRVINYCEKIGSKLFLVELLRDNYSLTGFLQKQKNCINIPYELVYKNSSLHEEFLDLGFDMIHPGPEQHKAYKNIILDFINQSLNPPMSRSTNKI